MSKQFRRIINEGGAPFTLVWEVADKRLRAVRIGCRRDVSVKSDPRLAPRKGSIAMADVLLAVLREVEAGLTFAEICTNASKRLGYEVPRGTVSATLSKMAVEKAPRVLRVSGGRHSRYPLWRVI
jgi:hypothetical protein